MARSLSLSSAAFTAALLAGSPALSQSSPPYLRTITSQAYVPLTGGTPVSLSSRDDGEGLVPIGFPFTYFGQTYTHVTVGSNGALSLSPPCTSNSDCADGSCDPSGFCLVDIGLSAPNPSFPSTSVPDAMIGAVWDDLNLSVRGDVTTQVVGTAPNRELVVQYENAPHYDFLSSDSSTQSNASFQVRFSEATGAVSIHYGPFVEVTSENGTWSWANGVEDATGTQGSVGVPCATNSSCSGVELTARTNTVITWEPPSGAELVASGFAPTGGRPGEAMIVDVTAQNVGASVATGPFFVDVYLSTDTTITSTDTYLGRLTFSDLGALDSETQSLSTAVPGMLAPGTYTIGALVDPTDAVTEVLENNNEIVFRSDFLIGEELSIEVDLPPDAGPGEVVDVTVRILNGGAAQAGVNAQVFLSLDQNLDPNDYLVLSSTVAVPAQPVTELTVTSTLPIIQPGDYWMIAVVDPNDVIAEVDETNNQFVTESQIFLDGADLVAEEIRAASPFAFRGQTLDATGVILNEGGARADGFRYGLYLSSNPLCSAASDLEIATVGPVTLPALGRLDLAETATVPSNAPAGEAYLCLIVNATGAVLEQSLNNNLSRTVQPLTVRDPGADFVAADVRVPAGAAAGESLLVERVIRNLGNAADAVDYRVYLSTDAVVDPTDVLLGAGSVSLAEGGVSRDVDTLRVPVTTTPGRYSVLYTLDPDGAVDELYEDNNLAVSTSSVTVSPSGLAIVTEALPVAVVGEMYDVTVTAVGGVGAFTWAVEQGSLPSGLSLDAATGRIFGVPDQAGAADLVLSATAGGLAATKAFELLVADPSAPLEVLTQAVPIGYAGQRYRYELVAYGGVPPYSWVATDPQQLPDGFTLTAEGAIEGLANSSTLGGFTARVTDARGDTAEKMLVLRIIEPRDAVRIADAVLPDGRLGEAYDEVITAETNTGEAPFVFEISEGAPPPGLSLDADGTLAGTPTQVGAYAFGVRLTDARGDFDLSRCVVEIDEGDGIAFITNALPRGLVGTPYLDDGAPVEIVARSETSSVTLGLVQGELPPGLALEGAVVSGTPISRGTFSFVVQAQDAAGQQDLRAYGIVVDEPEVEPPPLPPDEGCRCVTGSAGAPAGLGWLLLGFGLVALARRRRGALFAALIALGAPSVASAQAQYFVDTRSEAYTPRTGGTSVSFSSSDDGDAQVSLPFTFRYFEDDYTSIYVGTNCVLRFGDRATSRFNTSTMPSTDDIETVIAPFWDDCIGPTATTHVEGTAPTRRFVIQYSGVEHFISASGGQLAFQVILHEGPSARFEVHYGPATGMTDPLVWSATSGYEDSTGMRGGALLPCGGACDGDDFLAAENRVVRVQQDAGIEVVADAVTGVPPRVFTGVPFSVTAQMRSLHTNPIGPFVYEVHLLAPGETTPNRPIFTSAPVTLAAFEQLAAEATPTVPLGTPAATYRLALVVDSANQLVEGDETNNVVISDATFDLAAPQPDFAPVDVVPTATVVAPGDTLDVDVLVRNRGNAAGSTEWRLVLSRNDVISADDLELDRGTVNLDLLTTSTITTQVSLPAEAETGDYVLGLVLDADDLVAEIDELNNVGRTQGGLRITAGQLAIRTSALPGAYLDIGYTHYLRAEGGDGAYTWSVDAGALPAGLSLDADTGEIFGTPTELTSAQVTVAVESAGERATRELTLEVVEADGVLTIVTRSLLPGVVGGAYPPVEPGTPVEDQPRIEVVGAQGEVTFSADRSLPAGLQLDEDGRVFGVPLQAGRFVLAVRASDGVAEAAREVALTIAEPGRLTLVAEPLPDATLGLSYAYDFRAVGAAETATVTFQASAGLPPGLIVSTAGAVLGAPDQIGTFDFTVTVTAGSGPTAPRDSDAFRIVVRPDGGFEITPRDLPSATVGEAYEQTLGARNGEAPLSWRVLGPPLPEGLEFEVVDAGEGQVLRFRGTPTVAGTSTVLVRCTDAIGRVAQAAITVDVVEPEAAPPPPPEPEGCACTSPGRGPSAGLALLLFGALGLRRRRR